MTEKPTFPIVIAEWPKNQREQVRVELDTYHGTTVISVRTWFWSGDDLRPSKAGIALSARHLAKLARALTAAVDKAHALGIAMDSADAAEAKAGSGEA
jgi:hypothetical protein